MKIDFKIKMSIALIGVLMLTLLAPTTISADAVTPKIQFTLTQQQQHSTTLINMDVYLANDNTPLSGRTISFLLNADYFGKVPVIIGNSITDDSGKATVSYEPTQEGVYSITARFTGDSKYGQTQSTQSIEITTPIASNSSLDGGLVKIGKITIEAVGLLVVTIWGLIIFVIYRSVFGISKVGNKQ